ncbi:MAG: hypothetical protein GKR95_13110 [Gammaproteobacteria bacterium]|nr:hypothetical protein [Gammaproteobacteria bacterium]
MNNNVMHWNETMPVSYVKKVRSFLLSISAVLIFFLPIHAFSAETEAAAETETTLSYNTLTNEDLLTRTNDTYQEAYALVLSETRALAKTSFLLEKAREERTSFTIGHAIDGIAFGSSAATQSDLSIDQTKASAETAEEKLDNHAKKVQFAQSEYDLLQAHIAQLTHTQSAILSLRDIINSLQLPLLEIGLRIADGTLSQNQVPRELSVTNIQDQLDFVEVRNEELKTKSKHASQELEGLTTDRDTLVAKLPEYQTAFNTAKNRLSEALKRQSLLQEFDEYEPQTLLRTLKQMQGEMIGLRGTFQISANRYNRNKTKIDLLEKDLARLEEPAIPNSSVNTATAEELEQLLEKIGEVVEY